MTFENLKNVFGQRPFQPTRVVTSSGKVYEVRHADAALLTKSSLVLAIPDPDEEVAETFTIVSLLHISSLEPLAAA